MAGEEEKQNSGAYSLEEILAEFGGKPAPAPPAEPVRKAAEAPPPPPEPPREQETARQAEQAPAPAADSAPAEEPAAKKESPPHPSPAGPGEGKGKRERKAPKDGNVVPFPEQEEESPLARLAERLNRRADAYAEHMFEEEGEGEDPETRRVEELVPGVDREEPSPAPRRKRRVEPPAPDLPAKELLRTYNKGLKNLRTRAVMTLLLTLVQLYLVLGQNFSALPMPPWEQLDALPIQAAALPVYGSAALLLLCMLLGADVIARGLGQIFRVRIGMDTLTALACFAALADALTMPALGLREGQLPYCALASLALFCAMWGTYRKRCGQRLSCRTAASAKEPYRVTLDEGKWSGRDTFTKWQGDPAGFGSQIQGRDGAERMFGVMAPLLLTAAVLFALISSLGQRMPERILWCLSANLSAAASLSGMLTFGRPFYKLSRHLARSGAALAGWDGAAGCGRESRLVLSDADLFPPGTVSLNGIKVFGDHPVEQVIGYTASVIRASGSGLTRIFHDLLRTQGAVYREVKDVQWQEGGAAAVIRSRQVLVGTASFMTLMEVPLPKGLSVKNAVFCAMDGELAGIFALHYTLHPAVPPALDALLKSGVHPVLATRDCNLIPAMLRQRFKLPADRMEFPPVERRRELSDEEGPHSEALTAVLCREGLAPFADAVVGAMRLRRAVRLSTALACVGAVLGLLMSFYLTFVGAFASMSAFNLTVFSLLWLVPTLLISGWVDQY